MNSPNSSNAGNHTYSSRNFEPRGANSSANTQLFAEDFALEHTFARATGNQVYAQAGSMIPAAIHESVSGNQYSPSCAYQG